jgi:hypothetical protein
MDINDSAGTDKAFNFMEFATSLGDTVTTPPMAPSFVPLQLPHPFSTVDPRSNAPILLQPLTPNVSGSNGPGPLIWWNGQYFAPTSALPSLGTCSLPQLRVDTAFVNGVNEISKKFGTAPNSLHTPELDSNMSDSGSSVQGSPTSSSPASINARLFARSRVKQGKKPLPYSADGPLAGLFYLNPDRLAGTKRTADDLEFSDRILEDVSSDGSVYEDELDELDEDVIPIPTKPKAKKPGNSRSRSKSSDGSSSGSDGPSLKKKMKNQSGEACSPSGSCVEGGDGGGDGGGSGTENRKERRVGDFVCGFTCIRRGKTSHYTIKGLKIPEVGESCTMRCISRTDLARHRRESDWHVFPEECERCGKTYNLRKDGRARHMSEYNRFLFSVVGVNHVHFIVNCMKKQRRPWVMSRSPPPPTRRTRSMKGTDEE